MQDFFAAFNDFNDKTEQPKAERPNPVSVSPTPEPAVAESSAPAVPDLMIPVDRIDVIPGHNPRTFFDPVEQGELEGSIRELGVIQPVVVRPAGDRYELVVGERRLRATRQVGLATIPAYVRDLDDEQAQAMAAAENISRAAMSAVEEAQAARRYLAQSGGSREAARTALGWSQKRMESRLALLNAAPRVQDALTRGLIRIGHAELLATLPEDIQNGSLDTLIQEQVSVSALRERIDNMALYLHTAVFDTEGCKGCPHNSTEQSSLFEESIGAGRCTNRTCWNEKEAAHIAVLKDGLRETFPAVRTDQECVPGTFRPILEKELGAEQIAGCKGCAHYGAIIDTRPGRIGTVTENICFETGCYRAKMEAFLGVPEPTAKSGEAKGGKAKPAKAAKKDTDKTRATPAKVAEKLHTIRQQAARTLFAENPRMRRIAAAVAIVSELGTFTAVDEPHLRKCLNKREVHARIRYLETLGDDALRSLTDAAILVLLDARIGKPDYRDEASTAAWLDMNEVQWTRHFQLDRGFLEVLTKSGIESLLVEAGFDTWLNARDGKGAFRKMMGQSREACIDAVLKAGFDFSNFAPAMLKAPPKGANTPETKTACGSGGCGV